VPIGTTFEGVRIAIQLLREQCVTLLAGVLVAHQSGEPGWRVPAAPAWLSIGLDLREMLPDSSAPAKPSKTRRNT
jgi:hypothetical protein